MVIGLEVVANFISSTNPTQMTSRSLPLSSNAQMTFTSSVSSFFILTTTIGRIASSSAALTFASIAASQEMVFARIPALSPAFISGAAALLGAVVEELSPVGMVATFPGSLVGLRGGKLVLPWISGWWRRPHWQTISEGHALVPCPWLPHRKHKFLSTIFAARSLTERSAKWSHLVIWCPELHRAHFSDGW